MPKHVIEWSLNVPLDSLVYLVSRPGEWSRWQQTRIWWPRRTTSGKLTVGKCYRRIRVRLDWRTSKDIIQEQYAANEFDMIRADKHEAPL